MIIRKTVDCGRSIWSDDIDDLYCFKGGKALARVNEKKNMFTDCLTDTDCE